MKQLSPVMLEDLAQPFQINLDEVLDHTLLRFILLKFCAANLCKFNCVGLTNN